MITALTYDSRSGGIFGTLVFEEGTEATAQIVQDLVARDGFEWIIECIGRCTMFGGIKRVSLDDGFVTYADEFDDCETVVESLEDVKALGAHAHIHVCRNGKVKFKRVS